MKKIISAIQARKDFFKLITMAGKPGFTVTITLENHPPVVLMSQEEMEGWQETMEIMSDPELMAAIRKSEKETETITLEELERSWQDEGKHVHPHTQKIGSKRPRKASAKRPAKSA
ncbi:MAG: type II toxin-antitoxin system Phd/YefM family antitoxin [Candidatus Peribacteraceae bacterium]|nr:type II toxin-antitoxin system Phd/YefM family antitoxin [Candidatus Peribacteraceae bacterium]